jgi:O-antigen ligase
MPPPPLSRRSPPPFLELLVLSGNALLWVAVPFVARSEGSSVAWGISVLTCIWNPATSVFLLGLVESAWQEGAFADLLWTPGRVVMLSLFVRMLFSPGLAASVRGLMDAPLWLRAGLVCYAVPTLFVSVLHDSLETAYATLANLASVLALQGLFHVLGDVRGGLRALLFGLLPALGYYSLGLLGVLEPTRTYSGATIIAIGRMNRNATAGTLVVAAVLALFLARIATTRRGRIVAVVTAVSSGMCVVLTGSRGGLLALLCGTALALLIVRRNKRLERSLGWVLAGLLVAIPVVSALEPRLGTAVDAVAQRSGGTVERLWNEAHQDSRSSARKMLWETAVAELAAHPLAPDYSGYRDESLLMTHNTFLEVGLQGGVLAAVGWALMLLGALSTVYVGYRRFGDPAYLAVLLLLTARAFTMSVTAMPGDKLFLALVVLAAVLWGRDVSRGRGSPTAGLWPPRPYRWVERRLPATAPSRTTGKRT